MANKWILFLEMIDGQSVPHHWTRRGKLFEIKEDGSKTYEADRRPALDGAGNFIDPYGKVMGHGI